MISDLYPKTEVATYQPQNQGVIDLTLIAKKDYQIGFDILHRPWNELNDYSVLDRMNKDQRTFNSFVDESVDDPAEAWKWRGTRSVARNKAIVMHAHLTANYLIPIFNAVDEEQKDHREMGDIANMIVEWMVNNSNYKPSFLLASMGMLVNPVTYLSAEYAQVMQTIKERTDKGYSTKEIIDEVLSGFQANCMSADQVMITNAHQQNIQKQRSITERRWKEYTELKAKYGKHPNWQFVVPGTRMVYNDEDGLFYKIKDTEYSHRHLCEETIFKCRTEDLEVPFVNGVYLGNDDNAEWNPIRHRDNQDAPKYNITPFGYQRVNEHFFFFKSMINTVGWDDKLMDALYELGMNRIILDTDMPVAVSGVDKVDTSVMFPGAVAAFEDPQTKVTPLLPPMNQNVFRGMQEVASSMSDESVSPLEGGSVGAGGGQRAYMLALANQNAKIVMDGVRRTLNQSVTEYGQLMIDIAIGHLTTAQLDALGKTSYHAFLLQDQMVNGKKISKRIRFDDSLMGRTMTKQEKKMHTMKLLEEVGYPDNKEHLYVVNPYLFSKMRYMCTPDSDSLQPKSQEFEQNMMKSLYELFREDPLIEPEALVRRVLHAYFRNDYEELISKQPAAVMGGKAQPDAKGGPMNPDAPISSQVKGSIAQVTHQPGVGASIGMPGRS
jgi:hypothetical protein